MSQSKTGASTSKAPVSLPRRAVRKLARTVGVRRRPSTPTLLLLAASAIAPLVAGAAIAVALTVDGAWWAWIVAVLALAGWFAVEAQRRRRRSTVRRVVGPRPVAQPTFAPASLAAIRLLGEASPSRPLVTVVVPVKDEQTYLGDCLESISRQTFEHWRCIVVDDGSTDDSFDIANGYATRDARFSVISSETGHGLSAARNAGATASTTPYVTFLDSDDAILPWSLEARLAALSDDPLQAGTYSDWFSARWDTALDDLDPGRPPRDADPFVDIINAGWDSPFIATSPLMRRDVFMAVGGFDESMHTAEDMDFFARLLRGGLYFSYSGSLDVLYRTKQHSMIMRTVDDHLAAVYRIARWREQESELWAGAPLPYDEPLDVYLRGEALFTRAVYNLALAIASGATPEQVETAAGYVRELPSQIRLRPAGAAVINARAGAALRRLTPGAVPSPRAVSEVATKVRQQTVPNELRPKGLAPGAATELHVPHHTYEPTTVVRRLPASSLPADEPLFIISADSRYHVYETGPLLLELQARGVRAVPLMMKASYVDERQLVDWGRFIDEVYVGTHEDLDRLTVAGCFVLNDWSPNARALIDAAKRSKGVSFVKVEGVQDFQDVDTGRERQAYRAADIVLAQGRNDVESLPGRDVRIVGSSRLEAIWHQPVPDVPMHDSAVVNFNFTYNVMTEAQEPWIRSVVETLIDAGVDYQVSAHWAQKNIPVDPRVRGRIAAQPFRHLITRSGVLISRFSTVPFESMARGVPFIYFNPHGEKVPTFTKPDGAFLVADSDASLRAALDTAMQWREGYRQRAEPFFRAQVDVVDDRSSAERTADVIIDVIGSR